jgi:branched-chain amino acid transport system substrate-binding protein
LPEKERLPVISHWGITGGSFYQEVGEDLKKVDLMFLQTCSFLNPPNPKKAKAVIAAYQEAFPECRSAKDIFAPVGTAHAYDLVHLLALAMEKAGTIDRAAVRDALECLPEYSGLVRRYDPPFTPDRHDALNARDFCMARYDVKGVIVPVF